MHTQIESILKEVRKAVVGKDDVLARALMAILSRGHILLEDVPGVGKTTMAMAFAKTLGLDTRRVQFTSDTLPSDIIGFSVYDKASGGLQYQPGAVMTNLLLADEINRTSSKTQSALLEAMEERQVTVDGETRKLPEPFVVLATQNPVGSAGTQMLPSSQLDRFLIRIKMGYPDIYSQTLLMKDRHHENPLDSCRVLADTNKIQEISEEAMHTFVADSVYTYIAEIAEKTRNHPDILLGLSPRGALAVCRAAKANAYLEDRAYTTPDDVAAILADVAAHRLVLGTKAKIHDTTAEQLLAQILEQTKRPDAKEFQIR